MKICFSCMAKKVLEYFGIESEDVYEQLTNIIRDEYRRQNVTR